ncbi:hypothetical protein [Nitrincola iocasae]|uniref:Uncharacterized protein n=1 Tax=Nitrincola iocasae TaxID=2614693 RepID=A0A5J6LFB8_9GAMM|nr:hypothetical protein [Nitrincola iocasae]QEW07083.1 hypothetical protein F5I99_11505 [Nitrincola iocasae]
MNREQELVWELQQNEHVFQIVELEHLKLEWEHIKESAGTVASYSSAAIDTYTAGQLIREFGLQPERVIIKRYAGKEYVIFKGNPHSRKILTGTRYLASNPKVVRMAIGPRGIIQSAKGGFAVTAVLSVGIEVFDYFIRDSYTLTRLLGTVSSDLIKIGVSAIAGAVAGLAVGSSVVIGSIAGAPLIAAITVGLVTGLLLDRIDSRFGATQALIRAYNDMGVQLDEIRRSVNRNLNYLERNPHLIPCLFGPCSGIRGY